MGKAQGERQEKGGIQAREGKKEGKEEREMRVKRGTATKGARVEECGEMRKGRKGIGMRHEERWTGGENPERKD